MKIEEALDTIDTRGLKKLGNSLVRRVESTQEYASNNLELTMADYLIIGKSSEPFSIDFKAIAKIDDHNRALVIAAVAGGMCEMSEMTTKVNNLVREREA